MARTGVLLLGALIALSASCSKKSEGESLLGGSRNKKTYIHATISDAASLDPAWAYDSASHNILANIYEPLVGYKGGSITELEPVIAETVPSRENGLISEDGRSYTFPIRRGVKFHDGTELTPEDVRYSLMRFMLFDRTGGPSSLLLEPLTGLTGTRNEAGETLPGVWDSVDKAVRVSDGAVVVTLHKPFTPILTVLAAWGVVVPKAWCAANGAWDGTEATWKAFSNPEKTARFLYENTNGSGPFMLERWDKQGREVVLTRFDDYWKGPAALERAIIKGIPEFQTRKLMLAAGDADSIYADYLQMPLLQNLDGVEIIDDLPRIDMNPVVFFVFKVNATGNPYVGSGKLDGEGIPPDFFADLDLRKAFAHSFDYEGFIRDVNRGKGTRANSFIPKGLFGHNPDQKSYAFDLDAAERHFRKARGGLVWKNGFKFTLAYNAGNQPREVVANMIKRSVEIINPKFKIDTRPILWPQYLDLAHNSKLPMFTLGWNPDYPDPHNFAFPFMHSKGNYPSLQGYRNPEADELVTRAMTEKDRAEREKLYFRLQEIAYEDAPTIFILNSVKFRTQRSWVEGYVYNPIHSDSPYSCPLYSLNKS